MVSVRSVYKKDRNIDLRNTLLGDYLLYFFKTNAYRAAAIAQINALNNDGLPARIAVKHYAEYSIGNRGQYLALFVSLRCILVAVKLHRIFQ